MELKNYDELIPEIARMMLDHDKSYTGYQEDIYLYVDEKGIGRLELFLNVDGNSWIDDDHYTVCSMKVCYTDWTDTFQEIGTIADVLGWTMDTLKQRVAAWISETGDQMGAEEVGYTDVENFINEHQLLLDIIHMAEDQCFEDAFSTYVERATDELDELLQEVG